MMLRFRVLPSVVSSTTRGHVSSCSEEVGSGPLCDKKEEGGESVTRVLFPHRFSQLV